MRPYLPPTAIAVAFAFAACGADDGYIHGLDPGPGDGATVDAAADVPGADRDGDDADAGAPPSDTERTTAGIDGGADATDADVPVATGIGGVSGVVWAPGNAPGMVPEGQEIPVSGAVVYLSPTPPPPIPQRAYCASCADVPPSAVLTDHRGRFSLSDRYAGPTWLVIEKGQFRRAQQIDIVADVVTPLPADATTLPSRHAPDEGLWIPRIALAVGEYDHLEDILGKLGMGAVDADGAYVHGDVAPRVDVWSNGGVTFPRHLGSLADLVRNITALAQYHIVLIPCSGNANTAALRDPYVLHNLRQYVAHGGNLFITDWSAEWGDNVFPAPLRLGGPTDTPADAYDRETGLWDTSKFGGLDGTIFDSPDGEAVDPDLHRWLDGQVGPTAKSATPTTYDAGRFYVEGSYNTIESTPAYPAGTASNGTVVMDQARVYVRGSGDGFFEPGTVKKPLTVTYEPVGCGRVAYSTYHTTHDTHVGLTPQERVLVYLMMEIGTCRNPKY